MTVTIRAAEAGDSERIRAFYRAANYAGNVGTGDRVILADDGTQLLAVLRLVRENGITILRGMRVLAGQQRIGLGTRLLAAVDQLLESESCYCIPYQHLVQFYGQIGFREIDPDAAPPFLADRLQDYRTRRPERFCLMWRPVRVPR
jgi:GNAT superfamily N-acetyltransferase